MCSSTAQTGQTASAAPTLVTFEAGMVKGKGQKVRTFVWIPPGSGADRGEKESELSLGSNASLSLDFRAVGVKEGMCLTLVRSGGCALLKGTLP